MPRSRAASTPRQTSSLASSGPGEDGNRPIHPAIRSRTHQRWLEPTITTFTWIFSSWSRREANRHFRRPQTGPHATQAHSTSPANKDDCNRRARGIPHPKMPVLRLRYLHWLLRWRSTSRSTTWYSSMDVPSSLACLSLACGLDRTSPAPPTRPTPVTRSPRYLGGFWRLWSSSLGSSLRLYSYALLYCYLF